MNGGTSTLIHHLPLPGDQLNMAVCFWYFVKSDMTGVRYCTRVHWTSHYIQGTRNTRPCITRHPVPGGLREGKGPGVQPGQPGGARPGVA